MKHTLKKVIATLLAVAMLFCLTACKSGDKTTSGTSSVVADTSDVTSFDVTSEVTSGDPASSEETPSGESSSSKITTSSNNTSKVTTSADTSSRQETDTANYEKPYEGNSAILAGGKSSKYDSQAEALRKKIVNSKDKTYKGENVYYVSYKGSDSNTGISKDSPWKTLSYLQTKINTLPEGSIILFERGGIYRGRLVLRKGITLAAYGTGYKPCIYGSSKNYGDEALWKQTSTKNVWVTSSSADGNDIGLVVFDHGAKTSTKRVRLERLKNDYDMYSTGVQTYIYLSKGNPGKIHKNIEFAGLGSGASSHIITGNVGIKNVTIDNLCIKYGGVHGIQFTDGENITITNCEIGYVGGTGSSGVWYGNGIEIWEDCKNILIDNNWVYQCYDAGITNQGLACTQQDMTVSNNLVEYCAYNIEYFVNQDATGKIKNMIYTDNILRFAGYGCFDPENRQGSSGNDGAVSIICGWGTDGAGRTYNCENFVFKNNILDTSYKYLVSVMSPNTDRNAKFEGNSYYQTNESSKALICLDENKNDVKPTSAAQFKEAIAKFDSKAKAADFVSK